MSIKGGYNGVPYASARREEVKRAERMWLKLMIRYLRERIEARKGSDV